MSASNLAISLFFSSNCYFYDSYSNYCDKYEVHDMVYKVRNMAIGRV